MPNERINPGYAKLQLHLALATASQHDDHATRERAHKRTEKWNEVIENMQSGRLDVGSRTPVKDTPAWLTLDVVTGGFATGDLAAGGDLLPHEQELIGELDIQLQNKSRTSEARELLNYYFISNAGFDRLIDLVRSGCYHITVPEEGALLVAAWFVLHGMPGKAQQLISELEPYFSKVRFYPQASSVPQRVTDKVYLRDVGNVSQDLRAIRTPHNILAQGEAIKVWQPLREKVVAFLLETCGSDPPRLIGRDESLHSLTGNRPTLDDQHLDFVRELIDEYHQLRRDHKLCDKPLRKNNLAQAIAILEEFVRNQSVSGGQKTRLAVLCARYVSKRGFPGSSEHLALRQRQLQQIEAPLFVDLAAVILARLGAMTQSTGVEDFDDVAKPICADEANDLVAEGSVVPKAILRKLERCVMESAQVLLEKNIIKSADTLAVVLPQVTSNIRASGIENPELRALYATIYQAFRRRRSLLLLNYENQVQIEELPWVEQIELQRNQLLTDKNAAFAAAQEIARLTFEHFPYAIVPNKLLQEFRAIAKSAKIDLPLVDELAADIFMGGFTTKFVASAQIAAEQLKDSVYANYFRIDYDEILGIQIPAKQKKSMFRRHVGVQLSKEFANICQRRAPDGSGGSYVARNGTVIEQQQILTTQNMVPIMVKLDLVDAMRESASDLAKACFARVCDQLQIQDHNFHAVLIKLKNSAYAWRQMLVFLSFASESESREFLDWANEHMSHEPASFRARFRPAMTGLENAIAATFDGSKIPKTHQPFYGWALGEHWLLDGVVSSRK